MPGEVFFNGWEAMARTAIIAVLAYPSMLAMVRLSGNRTLAQMNAFDFIVTIALGSTLATVITSPDVVLAEGLLAFALLIGLQFIISWLSSRSRAVERLVVSEPILVLHRGRLLPRGMRRARLSEDEVKAAARSAGYADMAEVEAAVLETNGTLSIVREAATASRRPTVPQSP